MKPDIKTFAENLDKATLAQISALEDTPAFEGQKVRVMPDAHLGAECCIGLTSTVGDKIIPAMVGVDISCGVLAVKINAKDCDCVTLDSVIKENIPNGFNIHSFPKHTNNFRHVICYPYLKNTDRIPLSIGTLGSGNHYLELAKSTVDNSMWLSVHSGSRNFGLQVANYYQSIAKDSCGYLYGQMMEEYLHDIDIVAGYASANRLTMISTIIEHMDWEVVDMVESVHNYIDMEARPYIMRKGAISARKGEMCVIPINMRDGSLLCRGKGNLDWNYSAPHGAGRIYGRKQAKKTFSVEEYKKEMKGVYTSCVSENTLDECPMAYKYVEYIKRMIEPTVEILDELKPIYNFKAGE